MLSGKSLILDDPNVCCRVAGAALDVFLVRSGDGPEAGQRHFLFTAKTQDVLFGLGPGISRNWKLVAAGGSDSRVDRLASFGAAEVDNWVANLTAALIGRPVLSANTQVLHPAPQAIFPAGTRLTAGDNVVWARLDRGRAAFLEDGPIFGSLEVGTFVPLAGKAWITVEEEAALCVADTAAVLAEGILAGAVAAFARRLVTGVEERLKDAARKERQRLEARARIDRFSLSGALAKMAQVISPGKASSLEATGTDDPLSAACRLVAKASGIALTGACSSPADADPMERVNALAASSGFRVRRVNLDKDWFRRDCGPLLVFHGQAPGAALPKGSTRYDLYDAATGRVRDLDSAVAAEIAPQACMFYRPFPDRPLQILDLASFALSGQRADILMILVVGGLAALLGLAAPILTGALIDTAIPEADKGMLVQLGGIMLVCALAAALFEVAKGIALLRIEGKIDAKVQAAVMDRLLGLPTAFFKRYSSGDLASRCLGINTIHSILSGVTVNALLAAVFSVSNLVLLFLYDWQLAVLANAFVLANLILTSLISGYMVNKQRALMDLRGRQQGMELEYLTGINKLRLTGSESRAFAAWTDVFARTQTLGYQAGSAFNLASAVNAALPTLATMALYSWFFRYRLSALPLGQFLAFYAAFATFQVAMVQLVSVLSSSLVVVPLYERAKPILQTAPEVDATKAKPKARPGEIEISHVVFRYDPSGRPILFDLCIHVVPGEFVALVGDSGAGKSTLLRLLLGFETPEAGTIYYDGQDLRDLDVRAVRRQIGVVLQDDKPSAGSLFENISGSANLSLDEAWEAAAMVGLKEDILAMPMGMQTVVPPGGAGFSGGQIQRLLIARALARRPGILFFDEATSALDNKSQAVVSRSIESLKVTRLVVAHRLSTVMGADRIYVLRHGRVAETGTFGELMDKGGYFHELAKRQIA